MDRDHPDDRVIETPATTVSFADGVVVIVSKGIESTAASVTATIAAALELGEGARHPVLFDARRWPGGDPGGWMSVINSMRTAFSAGAMLVDSDRYEVLRDRMDAFSRLLIPFTVFTDIEKAKTFLAPYVDSSRQA